MTTPTGTLSSTAFWGRERRGHQSLRFAAFMAERYPTGLPDLTQHGVAGFYQEFYRWQEAKGFKPTDYTSDRQLRRIRKGHARADMSAPLEP